MAVKEYEDEALRSQKKRASVGNNQVKPQGAPGMTHLGAQNRDAVAPLVEDTLLNQEAAQEEQVRHEGDGAIRRGLVSNRYGLGYMGDMLSGDYAGGAQAIADYEQYRQENPQSKTLQELMSGFYSGNGMWDALKGSGREVAKDFREAKGFAGKTGSILENLRGYGEFVAEQLPNSLLPMAGMAVGSAAGTATGNPLGVAAGAFTGATAGNAAVEGMHLAVEALHNAGIDPRDHRSVAKYLEENAGELFKQAGIKGSVLAAFDLLSMGAASKILKAPMSGMKGTAAKGAGVVTAESAGEFGGEYFGHGLATGDYNSKEALLEALAGPGQAIATSAGAHVYNQAKDGTVQSLMRGSSDSKISHFNRLSPWGDNQRLRDVLENRPDGEGKVPSQEDRVQAAGEVFNLLDQHNKEVAGLWARYSEGSIARDEAVPVDRFFGMVKASLDADTVQHLDTSLRFADLKRANLSTTELQSLQNNPELLQAEFGLQPRHIDMILQDRDSELTEAQAYIRTAGRGGPLSTAAEMALGQQKVSPIDQSRAGRWERQRNSILERTHAGVLQRQAERDGTPMVNIGTKSTTPVDNRQGRENSQSFDMKSLLSGDRISPDSRMKSAFWSEIEPFGQQVEGDPSEFLRGEGTGLKRPEEWVHPYSPELAHQQQVQSLPAPAERKALPPGPTQTRNLGVLVDERQAIDPYSAPGHIPSTAQQAAEIFEQSPKTNTMRVAERRADVQEATRDTVLPPTIERNLQVIERQMAEGEAGQRFTRDKDQKKWDGVKSTNPGWLKKGGELYGVSKASIRRIIAKARHGQNMTPRQEDIYEALVGIAAHEAENDLETQTGSEIDRLMGEGFDITGNEAVSIGDLYPGDQVIVTNYNGLPEVKRFELDNGSPVLGGETLNLDPWETINTLGIKRSPRDDSEQVWTEADDRMDRWLQSQEYVQTAPHSEPGARGAVERGRAVADEFQSKRDSHIRNNATSADQAYQGQNTGGQGYATTEVPIDKTGAVKPNLTFKTISSAQEAVDYIAKRSENQVYRAVAKRIKPLIGSNIAYIVVEPEESQQILERFSASDQEAFSQGLGMYSVESQTVLLKGEGFYSGAGLTDETVLHELIHAATAHRIRDGRTLKNKGTSMATALKAADDLLVHINKHINDLIEQNGGQAYENQLRRELGGEIQAFADIDEMFSYGLTSGRVQEILKGIKYKKSTVWSSFVKLVRKLLGLGKVGHSAMEELLTVTDNLLKGTVNVEGTPAEHAQVSRYSAPEESERDFARIKGSIFEGKGNSASEKKSYVFDDEAVQRYDNAVRAMSKEEFDEKRAALNKEYEEARKESKRLGDDWVNRVGDRKENRRKREEVGDRISILMKKFSIIASEDHRRFRAAREKRRAMAKRVAFPLERVRDAYMHSSLNPHGAARSEKDGFDRTVKELRDTLEKETPPEHRHSIKEAIEQFKKDYINERETVWASRDGVASWHVAGRSGFNSRQAGRRGNALDSAESRFEAWLDGRKRKVLDDLGITKVRRENAERERQEKDAKKEQQLKDLAERIISLKPGDTLAKEGDKVVRVNKDRDGYPSSITISGKGIISTDKISIVQELYGGNKQKYRDLIDKARKTDTSAVPEKPVTTYKDVQEVVGKVKQGKISLEEYQTAFASIVANKEAITADIAKMTVKQMQDLVGKRGSGDKKADYVRRVFENGIMGFHLNEGFFSYSMDGIIPAMQKHVDTATEEQLKQRAEQHVKDQKEKRKKLEAHIDALADPKTLKDYRIYFKSKMDSQGKSFKEVYDALSQEQKEAYDNLAAAEFRKQRSGQKEARKTNVIPASVTTSGEIVETKHTKTSEDLFVVKPSDRVEKEVYRQWVATAKRMGGWYSRYNKGGAIPGFQFKDRESAESFLSFIAGETEQAKGAIKSRREAFKDDKSQTAVERLTEMADRLEEKARDTLRQDRQVNTARRAAMAASAEAAAESDLALATTMRNIAGAIESGKARFLDKVRQKIQVEELRSFLTIAKSKELDAKYPDYGERVKHKEEPATLETVNYAEFPAFTAYRGDLAKLGRQLLQIRGAKKTGQALLQFADDVSQEYLDFAKDNLSKVAVFGKKDGQIAVFTTKTNANMAISKSGFKGQAIVFPVKRGENIIILSPQAAREKGVWDGLDYKRVTLNADFSRELMAKATGEVDVPYQFQNTLKRLKRLEGMDISTPAELRAALREFVSLKEDARKPDKVKELERSMVGRQNDGLDFFPTPESVVEEMITSADIQEGMTVLEPSAGMGHIADKVRDTGAELDVVEVSGRRRELLQAKGHNLVGDDFLEIKDGAYDRIIMNPPFSKQRDIEHVRHAYSLLKPGGRLVAIMSEGSFFRSDKKATAFREWLEENGGTSEKLEEGVFNDPNLPVNTGVAARMVVVDKQGIEDNNPDIRYSRKNIEEFVKAPDGSEVFGEISEQIAQKIRRQKGEIKLQVGIESDSLKFGAQHIGIRHKEIKDISAFVYDVAKNYNEVWRGDAGQLLLVKKNGVDNIAYIQLKPSINGDFYTVNSAFRTRKHKGKELLWSAAQSQTIAPDKQPSFAAIPEQKIGQEPPNAIPESNSFIEETIVNEPKKSKMSIANNGAEKVAYWELDEDSPLHPSNFETDEKNRKYTDELAKAISKKEGKAFTITPKRVPDVFYKRDGEWRNDLRGSSRSDFEAAEKIAGAFGKEIIWTQLGENYVFNGVSLARTLGDKVFVDVRSEIPHHVVLGHELIHYLEVEENEVFRTLREKIFPHIQNLEEFAKQYDIEDAPHPAIVTELLGDLLGDSFSKPEFWDEVASHNPSEFRKIADAIIKWIDGVIAKIKKKGLGSEQFVTDIKAVRSHLAKAIADYHQSIGTSAEELGISDGDVHYSRKKQEEVSDELVDNALELADKIDISPLSPIFMTPEYTLPKVPAGKRMLAAALDRRDKKVAYENLIVDGITGQEPVDVIERMRGSFARFMKDLQKKRPEAYKKANAYLVKTDKTGKAFGVKHREKGVEVVSPQGEILGIAKDKYDAQFMAIKHLKDQGVFGKKSRLSPDKYMYRDASGWTVLHREGLMVASFEKESEAVATMVQEEMRWLKDRGFAPEAIEAITLFRDLTNRSFDIQIAEYRRIEEQARDLGLDMPTEAGIDESRRFAVRGTNGKKIKGAEYASREDAQRHLDALSRVFPLFKGAKVYRQKDSAVQMQFGLKEMIAQMGDMRGAYFPRQRQEGAFALIAENNQTGEKIREHGDLYINGKDKYVPETGEVIQASWIRKKLSSTFNRMSPLAIRKRRLEKMGFTVKIVQNNSMSEDVFAAAHLMTAMDSMVKAASDNAQASTIGEDEAIRAMLGELTKGIANTFKARGGMSSRIERVKEYWKGFETDMTTAGIMHAKKIAGSVAKKETSEAMMKAVTGRDVSWQEWKKDHPGGDWTAYKDFMRKRGIDPVKQPHLFREATSVFKESVRNDEQLDRLMGTLKGLAVVKYLGGRVSSAAINSTNLAMAVPPTIANHVGGSPIKALFQVVNSLHRRFLHFQGKSSDLDKKIFVDIAARGWDNPQYNQENAEVLRGKLSNFWAKFVDLSMWMFGKTESLNRSVTIHAAYRQLMKNTKITAHNELMKRAKEISDHAHGIYDKSVAPVWTRGGNNPLKLAYTFQKFAHNYHQNILKMWGDGAQENAKNIAWMTLAPAILAGATSSIATTIIAGIAKLSGEDEPEEKFYRWAQKVFGDRGETFARHGLAGLAGVNLTGSMQPEMPFPAKDELLGAPGSMFADGWKGIEHARSGEWGKAFERTFPHALGNIGKAYREYTEGISTGSYGTIFYGDEPLKATASDAFFRAFSFNPSGLSAKREQQWSEKKVEQAYRDRKSRLYRELKRLYLQYNGHIPDAEYGEFMAKVAKLNHRIQMSGYPWIKPVTSTSLRTVLRRSLKASRRERLRKAASLMQVTPKTLAQKIRMH